MDSRLLIGNRQQQDKLGGTGISINFKDHLVMKPFTRKYIKNQSIIIKHFRGLPKRIWNWNRKRYSKPSGVFWTEAEGYFAFLL